METQLKTDLQKMGTKFPFLEQISSLKSRLNNQQSPQYDEAKKAVQILETKMMFAIIENKDHFQKLKEKCHEAINEALPVLSQHRGIKGQLLRFFGLSSERLKTRSLQQVEKMKKAIEDIRSPEKTTKASIDFNKNN